MTDWGLQEHLRREVMYIDQILRYSCNIWVAHSCKRTYFDPSADSVGSCACAHTYLSYMSGRNTCLRGVKEPKLCSARGLGEVRRTCLLASATEDGRLLCQ